MHFLICTGGCLLVAIAIVWSQISHAFDRIPPRDYTAEYNALIGPVATPEDDFWWGDVEILLRPTTHDENVWAADESWQLSAQKAVVEAFPDLFEGSDDPYMDAFVDYGLIGWLIWSEPDRMKAESQWTDRQVEAVRAYEAALIRAYLDDEQMQRGLDRWIATPTAIKATENFGDSIESVMRYLSNLRRLALLELSRGARAAVHSDEAEFLAALSRIEGIIGVLMREPVVINALVAASVFALGNQLVELALTHSTLSEEATLEAIRIVERMGNHFDGPTLSRMAQGEYLFTEYGYAIVYNGLPNTFGNTETVSIFERIASPPPNESLAMARECLRIVLAMLDGTATDEDEQRLAEIEAGLPSYDEADLIPTGFIEVIHRLVHIHRANRTNASLLKAALAIEAYRDAHDGQAPDSLDKLVPRFLSELPRCAFAEDGRLRYLPDGRITDPEFEPQVPYLLYSVSSDGIDDGGDPSNASFNFGNRLMLGSTMMSQESGDAVFGVVRRSN